MTLREYFDWLLRTCPACGAEMRRVGPLTLRCESAKCLATRLRDRMLQIAADL